MLTVVADGIECLISPGLVELFECDAFQEAEGEGDKADERRSSRRSGEDVLESDFI